MLFHFCDTEAIVVVLLASAVFNIILLVKNDYTGSEHTTWTDSKDPGLSKIGIIIILIYEVLLAGMIFLSMRGSETVYLYFGFLKGKLAKAIFFVFCATLVYNSPSSASSVWYKYLAGSVLLFCSILQLVKYFRKDENDQHEEGAMMED